MTLCPSPSQSPITGNMHSLLQVSRKSAKTFCRPRSGELCGVFCTVEERRTETLCWAERKPSGSVSCAPRPLLADAFMFTELKRCSNVSLQCGSNSGNRDVCKEQNSNCLPKEPSLLSWFHLNVHFCGLQDFQTPLSRVFGVTSCVLLEDKSRNEVEILLLWKKFTFN